jgi:hypothetical protein
MVDAEDFNTIVNTEQRHRMSNVQSHWVFGLVGVCLEEISVQRILNEIKGLFLPIVAIRT